MRISFDLDDTLICRSNQPCESPNWRPWNRLIRIEPLRLGSRLLFNRLRERGCEIWIYTSSGRSQRSILRWLRRFGLQVDDVVNEAVDGSEPDPVSPFRRPSKNPRAFGIDLHVDDSEGVRLEGERFGFRVLLVSPVDDDWVSRILECVDELALTSTAKRRT